jgi:hypothetical protein
LDKIGTYYGYNEAAPSNNLQVIPGAALAGNANVDLWDENEGGLPDQYWRQTLDFVNKEFPVGVYLPLAIT